MLYGQYLYRDALEIRHTSARGRFNCTKATRFSEPARVESKYSSFEGIVTAIPVKARMTTVKIHKNY